MSVSPQTLRDFLNDKKNLIRAGAAATFYRATSPKYATKLNLLDLYKASLGSFLSGGRFNMKGHFHVLYLSVDEETCRAEMNKYAARGSLPLKSTAFTFAPWEVSLTHILDLTDDEVRQKLKIDIETICKTDWETLQNYYEIPACTQRLGELARDLGFVALLTPSAARSGGKNLAVFVDKIDGDVECCSICDPDAYP
jgi:RES domain-containing protein